MTLSEKASAILILALPGTGKTSLVTHLLEDTYWKQGRELQNKCTDKILQFNKKREIEPLELPEQPPLYADITTYKVKFKVGYEKWFEPYAIDPYYMGMTNERLDTQYVLPYSRIHIPEIQRYADSRKGQTFPPQLSRLFEIRRHFHLKFIMDGHKGSFIDLKIRALCDCVIELVKQEHEYDGLGRIIKTIWYCREFPSCDAYDEYCARGGECLETIYEHAGNIFDDFDSFGCEQEFLPPMGKGVQFSTLKPLTPAEIAKLPKEVSKFYETSEPKGFRAK